MPRLPLLSGSRVVTVQVPDDAVVLAAPPPLEPIADVGEAVREALRFPLAGPPLEALAPRGGRVTVVVEPPALPLPGAPADPRREALAAVLEELTRLRVAPERQTVLLAGGLGRRAGRREIEALLPLAAARSFRGRVVVHDAEDEQLHELGEAGGIPLRVATALLAADLVVTVTAAETVLHGGPAALLAACGPEPPRAASADSLLEPATAPGWQLVTALEAMLGRYVPIVGVSLVLDHPRPTGRYRGWPWDPDALDRIARSPLRTLLNTAPTGIRHATLESLDRRLSAVAALAGPPSVAHVEALLRGVAVRAVPVSAPLDAVVVPVPWKAAHQPREGVDPITAAYGSLGIALRLWRERPLLARGGTVVLLHDLRPRFGGASRAPRRALYEALRGQDPTDVGRAEAAASADTSALESYRAGRAPHPLQPFADWAACAPALEQADRVIVGGCRDAAAARRLGFVPSHSPQAALEMALGVAGPGARVGVLVAPPYPPVVVG